MLDVHVFGQYFICVMALGQISTRTVSQITMDTPFPDK